MACCAAAPPVDPVLKQQKATNDQIDAELSKTRKVYCLIMLGTGESGKSTLFKQLKIVNDLKFTEEENTLLKETIRKNLVMAYHFVLKDLKDFPAGEAAKTIYDYVITSSERLRQGLEGLPVDTPQIAAVRELCNTSAFKEAFEARPDLWRYDGASYFLRNAERIVKDDFIPSKEDVLRARKKTTAVSEVSFSSQGILFNVCDIGGQRSERRKWYTLFMRDVTAILFVTAISEYDESLGEDSMTNRMHESLNVFKALLQQTKDTPIMLFLNKRDLFDEKIKRGVDLKVCFPNFNGDDPRTYVKNQFLALSESAKRAIFPHFTCALDTDNIRTVMQNVQAICIGSMVKASGL